MDKNITGEIIKKIRLERNISLEELSNALPDSSPLTPLQLNNIEAGFQKVYDFQLLAIANVLGVEVDDLFPTSHDE